MSERKYISSEIRMRIYERDNFRCRYCDCRVFRNIPMGHYRKATIDHFVPLFLGGKDDVTNLVTACSFCNRAKWKSLPTQFMKLTECKQFQKAMYRTSTEKIMKVRENSGSFEAAPTGTHFAICVGLCGIGTHDSEWQGKKNTRTQIIVTWELPNELMSSGKPFIVSQWYTRSLGEKANLRKDLISWRGRDFTQAELAEFEMQNILGKGCQVTIIENDNGKNKVSAVSGLPKGVELPAPVNELRHFDVEEWDGEEFEKLSDKLQAMVKDSYEYQEIQQYGHVLTADERRLIALDSERKEMAFSANASSSVAADDDIPF